VFVKPLAHLTTKTPVGVLSIICDEQVVVAAGFRSVGHLHEKLDAVNQERDLVAMKNGRWLTELIARYFDGDFDVFNGLSVRQPGSTFSQQAWRAMRKIPSGRVISYADLAKRAGSPPAVRAAGTACGRNAIAPIIPCHRIIRSDGAIGNYGYGENKKLWLLRHEGAIE
jgi:methylated-DNA-[protein]-cysteine S-methyltransferase